MCTQIKFSTYTFCHERPASSLQQNMYNIITLALIRIMLVIWISFLIPKGIFAQQRTSKIDNTAGNNINEEKFIPINGINQWVTIKGNPTQPVILFLHGGPGSPISPYSDNLYKEWKN